MKTIHTPGPWLSEPISKSADIRIFDNDAEWPSYVATVHRRVYPNGQPYHASDVETDRNARLISSAPELLAALSKAQVALLRELGHYPIGTLEFSLLANLTNEIAATITKATLA